VRDPGRDDPVTGRRMLTESAYADDRNLRARMAIWAYATGPADPSWRLQPVAWDGTQRVADVGCGNGFDLRQLLARGWCRQLIGLDLSPGMLAAVADRLEPGRVALLNADAQRLPLADACADVGLAMHMLYHVPDVAAAAGELRRVVRPGGTVLASANSAHSLRELHDMFDAVISAQLGRPARAMPGLSFTVETGRDLLRTAFEDVTLHSHEVQLAIPDPAAVVSYLDSVRDPVLRLLGEQLDFDAALAEMAARVSQVIRADGSFRVTARSGVFACR
jgi:ubiquinone/menaquinone biosynthesis C-methylase UbiE